MAYSSFEGSQYAGRPIELYKFVAGSLQRFYTSAAQAQTIAAQVYTPVPGIQRNETKEGSGSRNHDFEITLPYTNDIAALFSGTQAGQRVTVEVYRFHETDTPTPEVVSIFEGAVMGTSVSKNGAERTLNCRTTLGASNRQGPRRGYGASCERRLYSTGCGADDTDVQFRASALSVTSQVGNVLTITSGLSGTYSAGWFVGGYVEDIAAGDFRTILAQSGDVLTLMAPFRSLPTSVNVFAGCDHTSGAGGCQKFDRVEEGFAGFAFVPNENPYENGIR